MERVGSFTNCRAGTAYQNIKRGGYKGMEGSKKVSEKESQVV